jgi:hypothetical protein
MLLLLPAITFNEILTAVIPLIGVIASHFLHNFKLSKIYLTSNSNLERAYGDVKNLVAQCEQLKAQLKQAQQPTEPLNEEQK